MDGFDLDKQFELMHLAKEMGDYKESHQEGIFDDYKQFKITKDSIITVDNTCIKKQSGLNLAIHQRFLQSFYTSHQERGILLYHGTGSGKTYTSISMAISAIDRNKIDNVILLAPASLKKNFENHVNKFTNFFNYKNFADKFKYITYNSTSVLKTKLDSLDERTLIIIEEAHNVISMIRNDSKIGIYLYKQLMITKARIIALSATPIISTPLEYAYLFNILSGKNLFSINNFMQIYYSGYELRKKGDIYNKIKNLVSYYQGANDDNDVFPQTIIHSEHVTMSKIQSDMYDERNSKQRDIGLDADLKESYGVAAIQAAILTYPSFETIPKEYAGYGITDTKELEDLVLVTELETYSAKFNSIITNIKNSSGPVMIYSFYTENVLLPLKTVLAAFDITSEAWIGTTDINSREKILSKFNSQENIDGSILKVILISSAGAEGISLRNVSQIHILEPQWSNVKFEQIIGRAARICSHYTLPRSLQVVHVYNYISKTFSGQETIDYYINKRAELKSFRNKSIIELVKSSAIDCELNKLGNLDVQVCAGDIYT